MQQQGRISYADLGLYDDATEQALGEVLDSVRRWSPMPIGIQLAHAGRKASTDLPWNGGEAIAPDHAHGWQTVSASALAFRDGQPLPQALDQAGIDAVVQAFVDAARRAERLGLALIELHAAHGYLMHQFLSPLSNQRSDAYGGSLENRMRLTLRIFDAVRAAVSDKLAIGVRISATDWVEGGWDLEQSIALSKALDARGAHYIHVSSGGLDPRQQIPVQAGYQIPFAQQIKVQVNTPVIGVGLITEPAQAEAILGRPGRRDRAGARHPVRPALAVACRCRTGRIGHALAAIPALRATRCAWRIRQLIHPIDVITNKDNACR